MLAEAGLRWNGSYLWFGDSKNGIRKVVRYSLLKGASATLEWGVCLDFVPKISSSTIRWSRTEKSVEFHLFESPIRFDDSEMYKDYELVTHFGKSKFEKSLNKHLAIRKEIFKWFQNADSVDGLIGIAKNQIGQIENYGVHSPNPKFVLAFLLAKTNKLKESLELMDSLNLSASLKPKIIKLLEN